MKLRELKLLAISELFFIYGCTILSSSSVSCILYIYSYPDIAVSRKLTIVDN